MSHRYRVKVKGVSITFVEVDAAREHDAKRKAIARFVEELSFEDLSVRVEECERLPEPEPVEWPLDLRWRQLDPHDWPVDSPDPTGGGITTNTVKVTEYNDYQLFLYKRYEAGSSSETIELWRAGTHRASVQRGAWDGFVRYYLAPEESRSLMFTPPDDVRGWHGQEEAIIHAGILEQTAVDTVRWYYGHPETTYFDRKPWAQRDDEPYVEWPPAYAVVGGKRMCRTITIDTSTMESHIRIEEA